MGHQANLKIIQKEPGIATHLEALLYDKTKN